MLRALIIAVLGFAIGPANESIAVILVHYGLLFALLPLALKLPAKALWPLAIGWLAAAPLLWRPLAHAWAGQSLHHNPNVLDLLHPALLLKDLAVTGYYPLMIWLGYGLLGAALGRLELQRPRTAGLMAGIGGGIAALTLAAGWLASTAQSQRIAQLAGISHSEVPALLATGRLPEANLDPLLGESFFYWLPTGHSDSLLATLHAAACAVMFLGLLNLLIPRLPVAGKILAGAGRAPLTLYAGHLIALPLMKTSMDPAAIWWTLCAATLACGLLLGLTKLSGPLEYLVRVLSGADQKSS